MAVRKKGAGRARRPNSRRRKETDAIRLTRRELVDAVGSMMGTMADQMELVHNGKVDAEQADRCGRTGAERDDERDKQEVEHGGGRDGAS